MIKKIKELINKRRTRKEIEFLQTLPRYYQGYDTTRYFLNYSLKTKMLSLKSKKTGEVFYLNTREK